MRLREEPRSIQEALSLAELVQIYGIDPGKEITVIVDSDKFLFRMFRFEKQKETGEIRLVESHGPSLSGFLRNEVYVTALLNINNTTYKRRFRLGAA